ncbi:hypothetical protein MN608_05744 [Microdochium nivale]|nr:hypothetical protein MN608_05744 [Microdochium nivale]
MFPFFIVLSLLSAFVGASTVAKTAGIALDARASDNDYYPGYNNTCVSWHIEPSPDNTQLNLVAKCEGGNPAVDGGMVCSQIDLNSSGNPPQAKLPTYTHNLEG